MRSLIQRVKNASVQINNETYSSIDRGLLILIGVSTSDDDNHCDILARKISGLRIFDDENGKMNLSCEDINGSYLVVSQFTLLADLSKGKRPGFDKAMRPPKSKELYESFCTKLAEYTKREVKQGKFGETMLVNINNDGPATFILDV